MRKEWEVRREREGVRTQTEKRHSILVTVRSRLGLQHQTGLCERLIRELLRIWPNLSLRGDLGHRSVTQVW